MPRLAELPLDRLYVDPVNPRRGGAGDVTDLAASISDVGVLNPLIVRVGLSPGRYGVLSGQRRLTAARKAGLATVPCMVHEPATDADALVIATAENVGRKAMNPIEDAQSFRRILDAEPDLTQRQLADRLGVSEYTVSTRLQLLTLPPAKQQAIAEGRLSASAAYNKLKRARPRTGKNGPRKRRRKPDLVDAVPRIREAPKGCTNVPIPNPVLAAVRVAASRARVPAVAWIVRVLSAEARRSAA